MTFNQIAKQHFRNFDMFDKVRIITSHSQFYLRTGTVRSIRHVRDLTYYMIMLDNSYRFLAYLPTELELL